MAIINILLIMSALAGAWQVFVKAGREGWEALIPIYNIYVLTQLTAQPWWLVILCFVPLVNLVALAILCIKLSECFGKTWPYGIGLLIFPFFFYPLLGFGEDRYTRPALHYR